MSNNDSTNLPTTGNNAQANPEYYSQEVTETLAGGNRMAEALQETVGTTRSSQPLNEALASPDLSPLQTSQSQQSFNDAPSQLEENKEGTYIGFSDADTVPDNVEGWAGPEFVQDDDDSSTRR